MVIFFSSVSVTGCKNSVILQTLQCAILTAIFQLGNTCTKILHTCSFDCRHVMLKNQHFPEVFRMIFKKFT